jgi:hypothetical protein
MTARVFGIAGRRLEDDIKRISNEYGVRFTLELFTSG